MEKSKKCQYTGVTSCSLKDVSVLFEKELDTTFIGMFIHTPPTFIGRV